MIEPDVKEDKTKGSAAGKRVTDPSTPKLTQFEAKHSVHELRRFKSDQDIRSGSTSQVSIALPATRTMTQLVKVQMRSEAADSRDTGRQGVMITPLTAQQSEATEVKARTNHRHQIPDDAVKNSSGLDALACRASTATGDRSSKNQKIRERRKRAKARTLTSVKGLLRTASGTAATRAIAPDFVATTALHSAAASVMLSQPQVDVGGRGEDGCPTTSSLSAGKYLAEFSHTKEGGEGLADQGSMSGGSRPLNPEAKPFVPRETEGAPEVSEQTQIATVEEGVQCEMKPKELFMGGQLEGTKQRFLIDTGAQRSVMGAGVLAQLPRQVRESFRTRPCNLLMANKQVETAPGPILCEVTVAGRTILEPFCVLRDLEGVILGMPALHELGFEASLAGVDLVPTQPRDRVRQTAPACGCQIQTLDAVEIPARSDRVVLARTGTGMDGRQVMVTPHDVAGGLPSSLMVARAVVIPVASRVLVRVCNTSDQPLSIRANQPVAEAQEVEVLENTATVEGDDELPEHLLGLWHSACEQGELNDQVAEQLKSLLKKYSKLFACSDVDLGRTTLVQHDIDTGMSPPIRQPPRRVPGGQLAEFEAEIDRMLRAGVIEPGQSPWASPVVLV